MIWFMGEQYRNTGFAVSEPLVPKWIMRKINENIDPTQRELSGYSLKYNPFKPRLLEF